MAQCEIPGRVQLACSLIVLVASGPVGAQTQRPMPAPPTSPAAPGTPVAGSLEGKVTKVDLPAGTVQVSTGLFGPSLAGLFP